MNKIHSPAKRYGYVLMSSGFYSFFWALALMEELNEMQVSPHFNVRSLRRTIVVALALYVFLFLYLLRGSTLAPTPAPLHWLAILTPLGLMAFLVWLVVMVHRAIRILTHKRSSRTRRMIGLTLMFFVSLPILQTEVNNLRSRMELR